MKKKLGKERRIEKGKKRPQNVEEESEEKKDRDKEENQKKEGKDASQDFSFSEIPYFYVNF